MPIKGACVVAGIGVTTLAEWREKRPEIEQLIDEARELARQKALQAIRAAGEKDWRASAEWLRLTFPADYRGNANKVEVLQRQAQRLSSSPRKSSARYGTDWKPCERRSHPAADRIRMEQEKMRKKLIWNHLAKSCQIHSIPLFALRSQPV
jgi:hypothetical protein